MKKGDKIDVDENLLRRVYKADKRYRDTKTGNLSSRAFAPRPKDDGKLSVDIERLTSLEQSIVDPLKFVLYRISTSLVYGLGLDCIYDPILTDNYKNLAHALVIGFDKEDESIPGILARKAEYIKGFE